MSHLCLLICSVEDTDDQMTELARYDLPAERLTPHGCSPVIEATVTHGGPQLLARLCKLP